MTSYSKEKETKVETTVISESKAQSKEKTQEKIKSVPITKKNDKTVSKHDTTDKKAVDTAEAVTSSVSTPREVQEEPVEEIETLVSPPRNIVSVSSIATTQYSHTTTLHMEGETYSIPSSPVGVSGNTISGTVTRTGIGTEKGSIILEYTLNFDSQGRYISGSVTSSGYVTAQINLMVGEVYNGYIGEVITTSYGRALSGSLVYPVRVDIDLQF
jgi:hypothetical protein